MIELGLYSEVHAYTREREREREREIFGPMAEIKTSSVPVAVTTIPVQVAQELLSVGYRYLDVRTLQEFVKGHVGDAVNIPYMYKDESGMNKNANFVEEVSKVFSKDDNIIVGCQSGRRSLMAANDLICVGFKDLKDMGGGMTAWIQSGLKTISDE